MLCSICRLQQIICCFVLIISSVTCRIHKLRLVEDERRYVDLTTFGFLQGGILDVKMVNFRLPSGPVKGHYGFTLDRTVNDAISPYLETHTDTCFLTDGEAAAISPKHPSVVFLKLDFEKMRLNISCKGEVAALHLYLNRSLAPIFTSEGNSQYMTAERRRRDSIDGDQNIDLTCSYAVLPITKVTRGEYDYYNTSFAMYVASHKEEGLYNLYFHNCPEPGVAPINMLVELYESNRNNFLSAGEMPLPAVYTVMAVTFLLSAILWTIVIRSSHRVCRIHWVMCALVYLKSMSLFFHAVNYYFIETRGEHVTTWAVLYYITHLLKGAVLFVTIVLVGTGWNFIKHILADRDKTLFMIVIPLQVLANVAEIILEESEEGAARHDVWRALFILVDMACCTAIIVPVLWSIRHLQDASTTDGKAAINLEKLKLFRHFYIMVICYIYFTRFIIYVLKNSVPFRYGWVGATGRECATLAFFVTTGYRFRPAAANPYFNSATDADDEPPRVISDIGILEGVNKVANRNERKRDSDMLPLMQVDYDSD